MTLEVVGVHGGEGVEEGSDCVVGPGVGREAAVLKQPMDGLLLLSDVLRRLRDVGEVEVKGRGGEGERSRIHRVRGKGQQADAFTHTRQASSGCSACSSQQVVLSMRRRAGYRQPLQGSCCALLCGGR